MRDDDRCRGCRSVARAVKGFVDKFIDSAGAMAAYLTAMGLKIFEYTSVVNKLRNELRDKGLNLALLIPDT